MTDVTINVQSDNPEMVDQGKPETPLSEPELLNGERATNDEPLKNENPPVHERIKHRRSFFKNLGPAFWTISSVVSMSINIILIVITLSLSGQVFLLKDIITEGVLGGLYNNFVLMDKARIRAIIPVNTQVPAKFDLPLETDTVVVLSQSTTVRGASVSLTTGGLTITNAPATVILPAGTQLPVHLKLVVPVDQKIPVSLNVNVDIPLSETDLHVPFVGLQGVVKPYYQFLKEAPETWKDLFCGKPGGGICGYLFR